MGMEQEMDWKELLREYMRALMRDDWVVAIRCADYKFSGTAEQQAAVWALMQEIHREEFPDEPELESERPKDT
jgi:hypothetical protein